VTYLTSKHRAMPLWSTASYPDPDSNIISRADLLVGSPLNIKFKTYSSRHAFGIITQFH